MPFEKSAPVATEGSRGLTVLAVAALLVAAALLFAGLACRLHAQKEPTAPSVIEDVLENESVAAFLGLEHAD